MQILKIIAAFLIIGSFPIGAFGLYHYLEKANVDISFQDKDIQAILMQKQTKLNDIEVKILATKGELMRHEEDRSHELENLKILKDKIAGLIDQHGQDVKVGPEILSNTTH